MEQLLLELFPTPIPTFANYWIGPNKEAWETLQALSASAHLAQSCLPETIVYCFGAISSGKTHLLQAAIQATHGVYLDGQKPLPEDLDLLALETTPLLALDHADAWDLHWQSMAFTLLNGRKSKNRLTLLAGRESSLQLLLREDLRTRIGSGLVIPLYPLLEMDCQQAIQTYLQGRSIQVTPEIITYLFKRFPRDLSSLLNLLNQLDQWSLRQKRPISLPLLHDYLQYRQSVPM